MKKHNAIIVMQLCYAKLNSIMSDINNWDIDNLRNADKAEILAMKDRTRTLINELDSISTIQLVKMSNKEVKDLNNRTNILVEQWREMRCIYSQLNTKDNYELFKILGIKPTTDWGEIKKAYRAKAKETHPDVNGNEEEFEKVQNAYEKLKLKYEK